MTELGSVRRSPFFCGQSCKGESLKAAWRPFSSLTWEPGSVVKDQLAPQTEAQSQRQRGSLNASECLFPVGCEQALSLPSHPLHLMIIF